MHHRLLRIFLAINIVSALHLSLHAAALEEEGTVSQDVTNMAREDEKILGPLFSYVITNQDIEIADHAALLHDAIRKNRINAAAVLLNTKVNPNQTDAYGNTPLHIAATTNNIPAITLLVDRNACIDTQNKEQDTPLIIATRNGNLAAVQELLETSEPYDKAHLLETTKLAIALGHSSIAEELTYAPFWQAIYHNNQPAAQEIIPHINNINIKNRDNQNAFCIAISYEYKEIIDLLLAYNADPNIPTEETLQLPALHMAVAQNSLPIVQRLLAHGTTNIMLTNNQGKTALNLARNVDINAMLALKKQDPTKAVTTQAVNTNQAIIKALETAQKTLEKNIVAAITKKDMARLNGLITHKEYVHLKPYPKNQDSFLHLAALSQNIPAMQLLLNLNANPNAQNTKHNTPLHIAAYTHNTKAIKLLLQHKANVNIEDINNDTPLITAINRLDAGVSKQQKIDTVNELTNTKTLVYTKSHLEKALEAANACKCPEIADILIKVSQHTDKIEKLFTQAIYDQDINTVTDLVKHIPDLNIRLTAPITFLHLAISKATQKSTTSQEIVHLLLKHQADPNIQIGKFNSTALHAAITGTNLPIVCLLLADSRTDLTIQNADHQTPLMLAQTLNNMLSVTTFIQDNTPKSISDLSASNAIVNAIEQAPHKRTNPELFCSIPTCFNKKKSACGRCKITKYCSKNCQREDWKTHQKTCIPITSSTQQTSSAQSSPELSSAAQLNPEDNSPALKPLAAADTHDNNASCSSSDSEYETKLDKDASTDMPTPAEPTINNTQTPENQANTQAKTGSQQAQPLINLRAHIEAIEAQKKALKIQQSLALRQVLDKFEVNPDNKKVLDLLRRLLQEDHTLYGGDVNTHQKLYTIAHTKLFCKPEVHHTKTPKIKAPKPAPAAQTSRHHAAAQQKPQHATDSRRHHNVSQQSRHHARRQQRTHNTSSQHSLVTPSQSGGGDDDNAPLTRMPRGPRMPAEQMISDELRAQISAFIARQETDNVNTVFPEHAAEQQVYESDAHATETTPDFITLIDTPSLHLRLNAAHVQQYHLDTNQEKELQGLVTKTKIWPNGCYTAYLNGDERLTKSFFLSSWTLDSVAERFKRAIVHPSSQAYIDDQGNICIIGLLSTLPGDHGSLQVLQQVYGKAIIKARHLRNRQTITVQTLHPISTIEYKNIQTTRQKQQQARTSGANTSPDSVQAVIAHAHAAALEQKQD